MFHLFSKLNIFAILNLVLLKKYSSDLVKKSLLKRGWIILLQCEYEQLTAINVIIKVIYHRLETLYSSGLAFNLVPLGANWIGV